MIEIGGFADLLQLAGIEYGDAIAERQCLARRRRGEDDSRGEVLRQRLQFGANLVAQFRVEMADRLIEKINVGRPDDRTA